jgi:hypothetical protein
MLVAQVSTIAAAYSPCSPNPAELFHFIAAKRHNPQAVAYPRLTPQHARMKSTFALSLFLKKANRLSMMNRESESAELDFCARQHREFQEQAWITQTLLKQTELATIALYLAGVDWFGHRSGLLSIADLLHKDCAGHFSKMAREAEFDCARFSNMLSRFSPQDREDIRQLVDRELFSAEEFRQRATEALDSYVGDTKWQRFNLDEICQTMS